MNEDRRLLLISVDGWKGSSWTDPLLPLPNIRSVAARGAVVPAVYASNPTVTWSVHATMVTGTLPKRHGVVGNLVFDRAAGVYRSHFGDKDFGRHEAIRVPTFYDVAHEQGYSTAAICWPHTKGARHIDWCIPEFYEQDLFDAHSTPEFWQELTALGMSVNRYGPFSAQHSLGAMQDSLTADIAVHLIKTKKPQVLMAHFLYHDSLQHDFGPDSPEARFALSYIDERIGLILKALESENLLDKTDIVIVGDHGFSATDKMVSPHVLLKKHGYISVEGHQGLVARSVWTAPNGGTTHVYILDEKNKAKLLPELAALFRRQEGIARVITPDEFDALGLPSPADNPHQGDLVLQAAEGCFFGAVYEGDDVVVPTKVKGSHGDLDTTPGLQACLVAAGPHVTPGTRLDKASLADVGVTCGALLGVALPGPLDGRVLKEILR
jgi:arylsulfatase A-like enzyme